ncbi:hypothetical protein Btru_072710 [Bulinus truncatus]|nr:hypothetical protein Btru_072710 [Bulinus truncatus]
MAQNRTEIENRIVKLDRASAGRLRPLWTAGKQNLDSYLIIASLFHTAMKVAWTIFCLLLCASANLAQEKRAGLKPCIIDGEFFASGQLTSDPCDRCRCRNGSIICNKRACHIPSEPPSL